MADLKHAQHAAQLLESLVRYPYCEDDTDRADMATDLGLLSKALATAEQQGKEAGQATDGVAVRFIAARSIKADSWLHDDRHEHTREFRAFYAYVRNKTNAIQACHDASPEDLYYIISFFDHWRARVKDGLEPDWRTEPPSKPEGSK